DVMCASGWYERPEGDPFAKPWKFHPETAMKHGSCPCVIVDLTGDGRNDIICGDGHGFGLKWWEQGQPKADGTTTWTKHMIDDSWSQSHYLAWEDIDGDGKKDLITGKRVRGHCGSDPGGKDPAVVFYYTWDQKAKKFTRHTIAAAGEDVGIGMQICVADLNGDKKPDIAVGGKTGTYVLINQGAK
ncbi:MAG: VCBS repeat-containing protein, partial [Pirellulales bacterium]|nr:VCBS repeat-containing protein [Pirellulales bacterium]